MKSYTGNYGNVPDDSIVVTTMERDFYFYDLLPLRLKKVIQYLSVPASCEDIYMMYIVYGSSIVEDCLRPFHFPEKETHNDRYSDVYRY